MHGSAAPETVRIFEDTHNSITSRNRKAINQRNKHVDTQCHYLRDVTPHTKVEYTHCSTENKIDDALRNPLDHVKFENHAKALGATPKKD